eukprot:7262864-Pyramimonas_sp.AAC.1
MKPSRIAAASWRMPRSISQWHAAARAHTAASDAGFDQDTAVASPSPPSTGAGARAGQPPQTPGG